jgi:pantoate kinase
MQLIQVLNPQKNGAIKRVNRKARAFSPAGISSFFQVCDTDSNGKPIKDLEKIGARGGGFGLSKGVFTEVAVAEAKKRNVKVFINQKEEPQAHTTRTVVEMILDRIDKTYSVEVRHNIEVPVGAGFGTSAGGAVGTALALSKVLGLNLTYHEIGRVAHVAEVQCKTGLGTISGILHGGCILVLKPGVPNSGTVDRIPISSGYYIVSGVFAPRLTSEFLKSTKKRALINKMGQETLDQILAEPSLRNFMHSCKQFAIKTGLATPRVKKLIDKAEEAGAVGAAQNMLGEAVHALVKKDKIKNVADVFEKVLPKEKIVVAEVCLQGAHLLP